MLQNLKQNIKKIIKLKNKKQKQKKKTDIAIHKIKHVSLFVTQTNENWFRNSKALYKLISNVNLCLLDVVWVCDKKDKHFKTVRHTRPQNLDRAKKRGIHYLYFVLLFKVA